MDKIFAPLRKALETEQGHLLADVFSPVPPASDPGRLYAIARAANAVTVQNELRAFIQYLNIDVDSRGAWQDLLHNYWKSLNALLVAEEATVTSGTTNGTTKHNQADWTGVYTAWKAFLVCLEQAYLKSHLEVWTLPLLYQTTKYLRTFAIRADATSSASTTISGLDDVTGESSQAKLEDAAQVVRRIFQLVSQDRSPMPNRKYGVYYIAVLLFKTYFRLRSISICKNIVRTIDVSTDLPSLHQFPKSHQVSYRFFVGLVHFLDERYVDAEAMLTQAWEMCLAGPQGEKQAERILMYLIPTRIVAKYHLPSKALLGKYERLGKLFGPLCEALRNGNLSRFDKALEDGEEEFVKQRIYLTLERGRELCLRNLLRKVYLAGGWEEGKEGERTRKSRVTIAEFAAGFRVVGEDLESDEVEGMLAGMIYKNLMKGYISRAHATVVLNKKGAFPGTGV